LKPIRAPSRAPCQTGSTPIRENVPVWERSAAGIVEGAIVALRVPAQCLAAWPQPAEQAAEQ
jgi:hypothetical protein